MLYCDRIDVSEGNDVNKKILSNECISIHYWYFLDKGFRFQSCNGCHDVSMMLLALTILLF